MPIVRSVDYQGAMNQIEEQILTLQVLVAQKIKEIAIVEQQWAKALASAEAEITELKAELSKYTDA